MALAARERGERGAAEFALRYETAGPASLQSPAVRGDVSARGQDDRGTGAAREQRLADGEAVHVRQRDIQEDELGRERTPELERGCAVGRLPDDLEPLSLEQRAREGPKAGMVVDDQDGRRHESDRGTARVARIRGSPLVGGG